jgi:lysophospholipase L1-like esterase
VLYFPLYNDVATLAVTLDEKAVVEKYAPYKDVLPIVYYGSSITQGGCASRPDQSYQALICKKNRVDFVNLGFSGSACGEDAMADYLSSLPCSLFVYDYDFNAPTVAHLQATHSRLYQRFRKSHPNTPVLMISRPDYRGSEEQEARVKVIEQTYQDAKVRKENVYFLHGKTFFAGGNVWDFTVDGTHPTDLGFAAMAQKIYQVIEKISKDFQGE